VSKPSAFSSASAAVRSGRYRPLTKLVAVDQTLSQAPGFVVRDPSDPRWFWDANDDKWCLRVRCHAPGSFSMQFEECGVECCEVDE